MKKRRFTLTIHYMVAMVALILAANLILGAVLVYQSTSTLSDVVRKNMLNISNTAAGLLNGDDLASLTKEDVGGPAFTAILEELTVFQDNIDIEFIYTIRQEGEDRFVFVVDPDPVEPAEFGEEIVVTEALREAGKGNAMVDVAPAEDRWGNFYTSYSPVFDAKGKVAGIVGVDFDAAWYDAQIRRHTLSIGIISLLSVLAGTGVVFGVTNRMRRGLNDVNRQLAALTDDVDALTEQITSREDYQKFAPSAQAEPPARPEQEDEIAELGGRLQSMHQAMEQYLDYLRTQANTDALTHIGNTTAYQELLENLDRQIEDRTARFVVILFDVDGLKGVNDRFGHICGDAIIQGAAEVLSGTFGRENVFRIGGDEFIAVIEGDAGDMGDWMTRLEEGILRFNQRKRSWDANLSVSAGVASYRPGEDHSFRDVFVRADEEMYQHKKESYQRRGLQSRSGPEA